jgi:hypothetical protein
MRVAIMQPYFLPYIGYFQLIKNCDLFVLADEYQYTKKGWINRNRAILESKVETFSIPVFNSGVTINEKKIFSRDLNTSLYRRIEHSYSSAPNSAYFNPNLSDILDCRQELLVSFIESSIKAICRELEIKTTILRLSEIDNNKKLTGVQRVINVAETLGASAYVNAEGGKGLYASDTFRKHHLELEFLESIPKPYPQIVEGFIDKLSIIDLLYMVSSKEELQSHLESFQIVKLVE